MLSYVLNDKFSSRLDKVSGATDVLDLVVEGISEHAEKDSVCVESIIEG